MPKVAPHTGAWIETQYEGMFGALAGVAPHTGAWIETKSIRANHCQNPVAPHTGAWIETKSTGFDNSNDTCRTPHGCVD